MSQSSNHELNKNYQSDGEAFKILCKLIQHTPEVDVGTFSGDPLEYYYFIEYPKGRLTRLIKFTTGEAKDLVKHSIQQSSREGYENAMELLESRYGDPLKILTSYPREIKKWPSIRAHDATAFR